MSTAKKWNLIAVDDYLSGELVSPRKHEYLGGVVYAMAGASNNHNIIKLSTMSALHGRLRGRPCRPFDSDTKIRIRVKGQMRFYYPDGSITCRPNSPGDSFQDEPAVILEVLSRATRRVDEGEKKDVYLTIPALSVYLLIEQEAPTVVVFRRSNADFEREVYQGVAAVIPLPEVGVELPLAEIYETVQFVPEAADDE